MSSINLLFIVDEYGELIINKPEVKRIPEFKILFDRDKGSIGDADGRKSYIACAEMYYIYYITDIRSIYINLPIEERKIKAIKDSKLPSNWRSDKFIDAAIVVYKEMFKLTAAGNGYAVAENLYYTVTTDTAFMQEELTSMKELLGTVLKRIKLKSKGKTDDTEVMSLLNDATAIMKNITQIQKDMIANTKTFPDLGNMVKILALKFAEEGGNLKIPVGGGEINPREL